MIISKHAKIACDRIILPFIMKSLRKLEIKEMYFKIIQAAYDKTIANTVLNGGKTEAISSKVMNKTRVYTLPTFIQYSVGISIQSNKARK
jgi:hypothetical protein